MRKPKVFLLCGLPGSGKTSFAKDLKTRYNATIFSSDELLLKEYGRSFPSEKFQYYQKDIREKIKNKTATLVKDNQNVVLDFGFWSYAERLEYIKLIYLWNASPVIYYFDVEFQTLISRLHKRNKNLKNKHLKITDIMLRNFANTFEPPIATEADEFFVIH